MGSFPEESLEKFFGEIFRKASEAVPEKNPEEVIFFSEAVHARFA